MKKLFAVIALILVLFIIAIYWSLNTTPDKVEISKLVNFEDSSSVNFKDYDSIMITASTQYKSNEFKNLMQGEHYRQAWATPIKAPIVFLDTLYGGMTIIKEGGGKQTQSLKVQAADGINYTLRSIDKNPEALIPEFAKTLGLENIVLDGISAQHPYGAIVVEELSNKAGILNTAPKIVFIPKQDALGDYNNTYGNRLYLFEYESDSEINWTKFSDVIEIVDTKKLQEMKMDHKENLQTDKHALVRARLFDLLIGDWDRHAKQWGWVVQKKGENYNAIPLPCDRDNAFFNLEGVIPNIIANKSIRPEMRPFQQEIDYLPGLVQRFDVYFLKNIPEDIFVEEAEYLQKALTDSVIDEALHSWPEDIYELNGEEIARKLKERRTHLVDYAKGFKKIVDEKELLNESLKGSEDLELPQELVGCFGCNEKN